MKSSGLDIWKGRILRASGIQEDQHESWNNSIDLYNCTFFNKKFSGLDPERVDVNFANWYVDNLVPLVYFRDPFIFVKPEHDKYDSFADTMEKVINIHWRKLQMKQQFKRVIKSGLLMPPGWIKTGYTAKIGQDIAKIEEEKTKGLIDNIKDTIQGIFKKKPEELTPEEQGILNEYIEEESVFATWVNSWSMLMPEGYQLVQDMPYLIEIEKLPRIDFLANPFYKNKSNIRAGIIQKNINVSPNMHKPGYEKVGDTDSETDIITLYHIQDRRNRKNLTISMESPESHFEGDWYPAKDGFDYEPLIFDESLPSYEKSNPYPCNVLTPIFPQILEQAQARTQMVKWRKRSSAIILAQQGMATEGDMRQIAETEAVQMILVSNLAAFQMAQTPPMPNQIFDVDEIIKQDLQMGTNMGQLMFAAQKGTRTATQANIGQSGLQLKASARVDVVEDFTVRVARKLMYLLWNFYDKKKVSEIIGEDVNDNMWLPLPDDPKERMRIIHSEIQTRIDAGSTAPPKDETVDRKQLLDAISIVANIAPERLKKDEAIKAIFKKFKFDKMNKIVISHDNEEIQAATQENELMLKGAPQVVTPNENHILHIQVHSQAKGHPLVDEHIMQHGKFMGIQPKDSGGGGQPGVSNQPQEGDKRPPIKATNPETVRQGIPSEAGINQGVQNQGAGSTGKGMM